SKYTKQLFPPPVVRCTVSSLSILLFGNESRHAELRVWAATIGCALPVGWWRQWVFSHLSVSLQHAHHTPICTVLYSFVRVVSERSTTPTTKLPVRGARLCARSWTAGWGRPRPTS